MSGPKSSSYTLTYEQRQRILEEQRRQREIEEEHRRCEAEKAKQKELQKKIDAEAGKLAAQIERLSQLKKESGYDIPELDQAMKIQGEIKNQSKTLKAGNVLTSQKLKEQNDKLTAVLRKAVACNSQCVDQITKVTDRYRKELDSVISEGFHLSFSQLGKRRKKENDSQIRRINDALAELSGMTLTDKLVERLATIKEKAESITDQSFLGNFFTVVVMPFVKECKAYAEVRQEHDDLIIRYTMLASECGVATKPVPYTKEGVEFLKDEIALLEQQALEQKEREYINAALEDAMHEMGYTLIGDRTVSKRSGKKIRHELYSLDNGTAVDVTYSDNGQISMELGGMDDIDRQPDVAESAQLVEDMKSFCSDYDALAQRLAEKGVQTKRISIMPPSVEYAQIFNSNDYRIRKAVSRYSAATRKKKNQSVMHRES